ncbi:hypothetical protein FSP39_005022 [Pinctada imbricata]|uniref:Uncharacterized protein n=1 Tax=Pinctada imbricata TaxID=66713 RepID=A0AA89C2K1_PINIB|nr:hypothetical protein FSP39_005022 [Pinctada imbricata]
MSRKRKQKAETRNKKYKYKLGYPIPHDQAERVRRALALVQSKVSIRKAAKECNLSYSFLQRRTSGEVGIDYRNGPRPVFSKEEEEAMAHWLSEMALRGMGLTPKEFMDFVQKVVKKERRKSPFTDDRPGYEWYYAFLARNSHLVDTMPETPLEYSRSKLTRQEIDKWYTGFRDFLLSKHLLTKPAQIWNADETGFTMGTKASKVIGPTKAVSIPHVTGGSSKERLTAMFCANADGKMMPPFLVYPGSKPIGCNPIMNGITGTSLEYSKKGWMTAEIFQKFLRHFNEHAGPERPVVLLIDSVSSHISMEIFQEAIQYQIELYRIVPNATHLMQPLDKGVFGPLKTAWNQITRQHYRANPGVKIDRHNFAEKLRDAFLQFYKPLTIVNSFKSSGIYPVDSTVISDDELKPGLTFIDQAASEMDICTQKPKEPIKEPVTADEIKNARGALEVFQSVLSTPKKQLYNQRVQENYDLVGMSPGFDTYKALVKKAQLNITELQNEQGAASVMEQDSETNGLEILAEAAVNVSTFEESPQSTSACASGDHGISCVLSQALQLPTAPQTKTRAKRFSTELPDNLTSKESVRSIALKELEKVKVFAEREKKAKEKYNKNQEKGRHGSKPRAEKGLQLEVEEDDGICMACSGTFAEDIELGLTRIWIECDACHEWIHDDCIPLGHIYASGSVHGDNAEFVCHFCL